nr:MAG TPA: helix-turn-helix domain protein [Caudoviricetes sp.]
MQTKSIGSRLKEERERLHLGQKEFAEITGILRNSIHRYETDDQIPGGNALIACAKAGIDIQYVLLGVKSTPPAEVNSVMEDMATYEVKPKQEKPAEIQAVLSENYAAQMGARLLEERNRLGLSQEVLSTLCGVSREMLGKYERGQSVMSSEILFALSLSGVNVLYVLTGLKNENIAITRTELAYLRNCRALPTQAAREAGLNILTTFRRAFEGKQ